MDGILLCFPITQDPSCVTLVLCQVRLIFLTIKHFSNLISSPVYSVLYSFHYALSLMVTFIYVFLSFLSMNNVFRALRVYSCRQSLTESNRLHADYLFLCVSRSDHPLAEYRHGVFYLMLVQGPEQPSIHRLSTHWC